MEKNSLSSGGIVIALNRIAEKLAIFSTSINPQIPAKHFFNGEIGSETAIGLKSLTEVSKNGITKDGTKLVFSKAGNYAIFIRQLISSTNTGYFNILKNGSAIGYAYYVGGISTIDIHCHTIGNFNAGDYVQLSLSSGAISSAWGGVHSKISIINID